MIVDRDDNAREKHWSVPCVVCGRFYYPGLAGDARRPTNTKGFKIRVSSADIKGFCSMRCQHIGYTDKGRTPECERKYRNG